MIILLFISLVLVPVACQEKPEPTPQAPAQTPAPAPLTPAPAPSPIPAPAPSPLPASIDEPKLSEEEICALIWNKIPSKLPDGYSKSDLSKDTRTAKYESDGQWQFSVFGKVRQEKPIVTEIVKKGDYWVDRESCNVTSYELHLTAIYYENTNILDISVKKQNEEATTETSDTPILRQEIKLKWLNAWGTAHKAEVEGCIENIGRIPIDGLLIEITLFDEERNIIVLEKCKITPDPIPAGEQGKFRENFSTTGKHFHSYDLRFILETGQIFEYLEGSGQEEPVFFYEMETRGI